MGTMKFTNVRANFPCLVTPKAFNEKSEPKYSVQLKIAKDDPQIAKYVALVNEAIQESKTLMQKLKNIVSYEPGQLFQKDKNGNLIQEVFKGGLRDGDTKTNTKGELVESLKGFYYLDCSNLQQPDIVGMKRDGDNKPIKIDASEIYSNEIINIIINVNCFTNGIGTYVQAIQGTGKGERLGGKANLDDFDYEEAESVKEDEPINF